MKRNHQVRISSTPKNPKKQPKTRNGAAVRLSILDGRTGKPFTEVNLDECSPNSVETAANERGLSIPQFVNQAVGFMVAEGHRQKLRAAIKDSKLRDRTSYEYLSKLEIPDPAEDYPVCLALYDRDDQSASSKIPLTEDEFYHIVRMFIGPEDGVQKMGEFIAQAIREKMAVVVAGAEVADCGSPAVSDEALSTMCEAVAAVQAAWRKVCPGLSFYMSQEDIRTQVRPA